MPPQTSPGEWTDIKGVPFLRVWGGAGGGSFRNAEDQRLEDRKPDRREMPLATGLGWSDGALSPEELSAPQVGRRRMKRRRRPPRAARVTESGNPVLGSAENQLGNPNKSFLPETQFFHLQDGGDHPDAAACFTESSAGHGDRCPQGAGSHSHTSPCPRGLPRNPPPPALHHSPCPACPSCARRWTVLRR